MSPHSWSRPEWLREGIIWSPQKNSLIQWTQYFTHWASEEIVYNRELRRGAMCLPHTRLVRTENQEPWTQDRASCTEWAERLDRDEVHGMMGRSVLCPCWMSWHRQLPWSRPSESNSNLCSVIVFCTINLSHIIIKNVLKSKLFIMKEEEYYQRDPLPGGGGEQPWTVDSWGFQEKKWGHTMTRQQTQKGRRH